MHRRTLLATAFMGIAMNANANEQLAWNFSLPNIEGGDLKFADHKGRVILVVNTASFCGFTPQYEELQALHKSHGARGLTVIGVPSRDFNQEYADDQAVKTFCEVTFGIDFPMTTVSHVKGTSAVPFYAWVKSQANGWEPNWNFNKVLIGRDGRIKATFGSGDRPGQGRVLAAIEAELAKD